jgi:hypothetical protein
VFSNIVDFFTILVLSVGNLWIGRELGKALEVIEVHINGFGFLFVTMTI